MVSAKHLPLFNTSPFDFKWERLTWTAQCRVCEAPGVGRGPICRGSEGCRSGALLPSLHVPWTLPQSLRGSWRRPALTPKPWLGLPACLSWAYRRPWCWGYGAPQAQSSVMSSYTGPLRGPEQAGHSGPGTVGTSPAQVSPFVGSGEEEFASPRGPCLGSGGAWEAPCQASPTSPPAGLSP